MLSKHTFELGPGYFVIIKEDPKTDNFIFGLYKAGQEEPLRECTVTREILAHVKFPEEIVFEALKTLQLDDEQIKWIMKTLNGKPEFKFKPKLPKDVGPVKAGDLKILDKVDLKEFSFGKDSLYPLTYEVDEDGWYKYKSLWGQYAEAVWGPKVIGNASDLGNMAPELKKMLPDLKTRVHCPAKTANPASCPGNYHDEVFVIIQHVNDSHRWTREQIADWLEATDLNLAFGTVDQDTDRMIDYI